MFGIRCGIAYLCLVGWLVFLQTHDSTHLTLPVLALWGVILAALPPLYFLAEYQLFEYWAKRGRERYLGPPEVIGDWIEEERARVKHNETLARNIWAGIMAILAALIIKGPTTKGSDVGRNNGESMQSATVAIAHNAPLVAPKPAPTTGNSAKPK